jgi:tripartite-type tricarboxylate transporter receptor subunit TctC
MLKSGDARALAVTSDKRMTALPDVPTSEEAA